MMEHGAIEGVGGETMVTVELPELLGEYIVYM